MKLKFVVTISFLILLFGCFSPKKDKTIDLNLDFENFNGELPDQWEIIGTEGYRIFKDSIISKKGQYSVAIESTGNVNGFKGLNISIPGNYQGENIEVSGYIKTENVKNGFAGLLLRIDPKIAFNNMSDMEINGTNNWKQYKISHKLSPEKTEKIVIGALLVGSGKIWVDDITVKIDGKLLKDTKIELWGRKADYDNEFDAGSRVSIDKFDENVIRNLELLGKIWGFIKYYHPNIVSGNFNWDYELLRFLPNYLNVKSDIERDELLVSWIKKFGYLKKCKNCETSPTAKIKPEISWINCSNITIQLSRKLQEVYASRSNKNNHYISIASGIGNPIFKNEKSYIDMSYSDDGFKLLSLFRYWNMVQYFYPYKHLTDKNWSNILSEYIPIFIKAKSELEYELAVLRLIVEINDSHGILWDGFDKVEKNKGTLFSPLKTKFIDNKLIIKDYCKSDFKNETKLSIGDIITHIDGTPINKIIDSLKIYYPHSNKFSMLRDMSRDILRSNKNSIKIKYISSGQKKETETELFELKNLNAGCLFKISKNENGFYIKNKVGVLDLGKFEYSDFRRMQDSLPSLKGLIIDIRNHLPISITYELASLFISRKTEFVKFSKPNIDNPGEFGYKIGKYIIPESFKYRYNRNFRKIFSGKVIALIDETTQSSGEFAAMALRSVPNSILIGSTTAGADGDISYITLPGGLVTSFSGIGVYYPNGDETQRKGIVPDITVKQSINGLKSKTDDVMEQAMNLILN